MTDIEGIVSGKRPRKVVEVEDLDGETVEIFLWPFPHMRKNRLKRIYWPEPFFHPY